MSNKDPEYFYFKHFKFRNRDSGFKVNTDGVLLGAWTDVSCNTQLLDIGTGTGVIPLMLLQKNPKLNITAVEIQETSFNEAQYNFKLNNLDIKLYHESVQNFASSAKSYDHIVSNPPFFQNSTKSTKQTSSISKHDNELSFEELWDCIRIVSKDNSIVSIIIPYSEYDRFNGLAENSGFFICRQCLVKSRPETSWIRVLLEYRRGYKGLITKDEIYLQNEGRNNWSERYRSLTKEFYLNA